jgi:hypothetical protein
MLDTRAFRRMMDDSFPSRGAFVPIEPVTPSLDDIRNAMGNMRRAVPLTRLATFDGAEWMPLTALDRPLRRARGDALVEVVPGGAASVTPRPRSSSFRLDYTIEATAWSRIAINQLYLPGWRVVLDGLVVPDETLLAALLPDGRLAVDVGPGRHRVRAWYDGPPGWGRRLTAALAVVAAALVGLFAAPRAVSSSPTPR